MEGGKPGDDDSTGATRRIFRARWTFGIFGAGFSRAGRLRSENTAVP